MALSAFHGGQSAEPRARIGEGEFRCFVRVRRVRAGGYVEFDFSIGDPTLFLEMILPEPLFREFCARNSVTYLSEEEGRKVDEDRRKWQDGDAGLGEASEHEVK